MTGAYMGVYGLSSMLFALLFTIYSSKKELIEKAYIWHH